MSDTIPEGQGQSPEPVQAVTPQAASGVPIADDRPAINRVAEAQRKQQQAEQRAAQLQEELDRQAAIVTQFIARQEAEPAPLPQSFGQGQPGSYAPQPQAQPNYQQPGWTQPQQPLAQQTGQQQINPYGQHVPQQDVGYLVAQEVDTRFAAMQREQQVRDALLATKQRVITRFGSVESRPDFYAAVDREVAYRTAQARLNGTVAPLTVDEDAANAVALRMGITPGQLAASTNGAPRSVDAPPAFSTPGHLDTDEGSGVEISERQRGFIQSLQARGFKITEEQVADHMASGEGATGRVVKMALAGKGAIGRSVRRAAGIE